MRVLITGATGFLGAHLARRLLTDGLEVRLLVRSPGRAKPLAEEGAELVEGEVTDSAAVLRALDDVAIVYHLAGRLFVPGVPASEYQHTHVDGTRTLLLGCRAHPRIERFVHCSTTGVLGVTGERPADETAVYRPTNTYERTKLEGELLVRDSWGEGFPAAIVRPGLVYGPGDMHLLGFFRSIQRHLFRRIGRRPVWLHPIYIDDLTEALIRAGRHPAAAGECFHIAGQEAVTIEGLAATIAAALGATPAHGFIPLPAARVIALAGDALPGPLRHAAPLTRSRLDFLTHSRVYDVGKAQRLIGFTAPTPLNDGIVRTVEWYRHEGYLPPARGDVGKERGGAS